jgi:hypothetical protein
MHFGLSKIDPETDSDRVGCLAVTFATDLITTYKYRSQTKMRNDLYS